MTADNKQFTYATMFLATSTFLLCILFLVGITTSSAEEAHVYNKEFYDACAQGTLEQVQAFLNDDPSLATAATPDGETCLHLTAISKNLEVAKLMIGMGADVNQRVTHAQGLRMIPLSWHVYAGNYEIVKLLLDNGADVNIEFDLSDRMQQATVLDISSQLSKSIDGNPTPDNFDKTHELLISRGGKTYAELHEL